jgi:hypothetical protein
VQEACNNLILHSYNEIQQTLLDHRFAHRSFAYSLKNYCGNICALYHRSLALVHATCTATIFLQFLELLVALVFNHPDNFQPGMPTSSQ